MTGLELRIPPKTSGWGFAEVSRRRGDFALAGAAVVVDTRDGVVVDARIGMIGAGLTPTRARTVEKALVGLPFDAASITKTLHYLNDDIDPLDDQHANAQQKRKLALIVLGRALAEAASRPGAS